MSAEIDTSNGRENIAFLGSRNDVWHRMGTEKKPGASIESWAQDAGLNWHAVKVPALADLSGPQWSHLRHNGHAPVPERGFMVRSDTGHVLSPGAVSDRYIAVQPREVLEWFDRYIAVDPRFQLDVAGSLYHGEVIWATATFREPLDIAGDKHVARVLMSTTFDGSGSTINQGTMTRVVCRNTLRMAHGDARAVVRTRHNTRFDAAQVGKELARIAGGFAQFKAIGDAMAQVELSRDDVKNLFKSVLDIPFDATAEEISTRKMNQFQALRNAYGETLREGTPDGTCWTALNAITRYVDHDRSTRGNGISAEEKQFASAQFGSGDVLKGKAMQILMPRIKDRVPVLAS